MADFKTDTFIKFGIAVKDTEWFGLHISKMTFSFKFKTAKKTPKTMKNYKHLDKQNNN